MTKLPASVTTLIVKERAYGSKGETRNFVCELLRNTNISEIVLPKSSVRYGVWSWVYKFFVDDVREDSRAPTQLRTHTLSSYEEYARPESVLIKSAAKR